MSLCFGYILGMFRSGLHPKPSRKKLAPEHDPDMQWFKTQQTPNVEIDKCTSLVPSMHFAI